MTSKILKIAINMSKTMSICLREVDRLFVLFRISEKNLITCRALQIKMTKKRRLTYKDLHCKMTQVIAKILRKPYFCNLVKRKFKNTKKRHFSHSVRARWWAFYSTCPKQQQSHVRGQSKKGSDAPSSYSARTCVFLE